MFRSQPAELILLVWFEGGTPQQGGSMAREAKRIAGGAGGQRYWREPDARVWVEAWRQSGQTRSEFARTHGIPVERLSRWARRLRERAAAESIRFHRVRVEQSTATHASSDERIELGLGEGRSVRLPRGFDAADLRRLLDVLAGSARC